MSNRSKYGNNNTKSRVTCFHFKADGDIEGVTDTLLRKESSPPDSTICQWGVNGGTSGSILWIEMPAGQQMRNLADKLFALGWKATNSNYDN